ncbi:MAG: putative monovalent cation/H+ antiporter subunit A [Chloroflexota bacterium]
MNKDMHTAHFPVKNYSGWLLALIPLGLTIYFASLVPGVASGRPISASFSWVPSLNIDLSFYVDGLSLILALLICGIGTLVMIYAGGYLTGDKLLNRFYLYLLAFMGAMLGVVMADNLIGLFVFWELTSLTSYLLIGYKHNKPEARQSALQALLVTGAGGLAMLAGLVLLGDAGGTLKISELISQAVKISADPRYPLILSLILLGALTKSAQFPFHFWLPNAMAAPAPVSAYLHSATMVKAGVYLLARLDPVLGVTPAWQASLTAVGMLTMLLGAYLAWQQNDLKRILAYSTVSALGTLVMLIGLGTPAALKAAVVFLVVHSLYKGALFMAAGSVDHETGQRDVTQLGGLYRRMPVTFTAVLLATLSMIGALPLFIGYIGKKLIYEATLSAPGGVATLLTGAALLANALTIVVAGLVAYRPFGGPLRSPSKSPHEAPASMWLGPVVLAALGMLLVLVVELVPNEPLEPLIVSAAQAMYNDPVKVKLAVWSGFNLAFGLSMGTLALGAALYFLRERLARLAKPLLQVSRLGPENGYSQALNGLFRLSDLLTGFLQNGYLRYYILTTVLATTGLVSYTLVARARWDGYLPGAPLRIYELVLAGLILGGALMVIVSKSRLAAVVALGVVGYSVSLIYILFNAPDLGMTQMAIETLGVILLVLILYRLPRFSMLSGPAPRWRDAVVAIAAGAMMFILVLAIASLHTLSAVTPFYAENSLLAAKGRNVVNVILVDFRGLDTLGEIIVLAVAAIGVFALLKLRPDDRERKAK